MSSELRRLRGDLMKRKLNRPPDVPLLGLGVTAACDFTGLPVVAMDDDGRQISRVVADKLAAAKKGEDRLLAVLSQVRDAGYQFVHDFDKFGEKGESSYIAVVHTDGNGMGKQFDKLATDHPLPKHNLDYVKALRGLSSKVNACSETALKSTVDALLAKLDEPTGLFGGVVPVPTGKGGEDFCLCAPSSSAAMM